MTYEFQYLMHLLGAASKGISAEPPKQKLEWNRVFELSQEQMINPLVGYALKKSPSTGCPEEEANKIIADSFSAAVTECGRRGLVISLLEEMEENGIYAFVVKGFSVSSVYASPETRISADTDICISPEDEEKTTEFLKNRGFEIQPRWRNGHHFKALHPHMGLLEVHIRLYDEIVEDVWFDEIDVNSLICQQHQRIITPDGAYYTLGDTDQLIFMVLHMIKHFISCGMSLRMMTDVALFVSANKDVIDSERLWNVMKKLKYDVLLSAVIHATIIYCGFSAEDFAGLGEYDPDKVEALLDDLEKGGWLGKNSYETRQESWQEYSRRLISKRKSRFSYWLYMFRWQNGFGFETFFPSVKSLVKNYPCLDKSPWLLPFVWIHRLLFRSFEKGRKTKEKIVFNEHRISEESKKRVELFGLFEML